MKTIFSFCLLVAALLSPADAQESDSTMIAWYNLDGQAEDNGVYQNDGTMFSLLPAPDRFGTPNSALEFNGSGSYISIPSSASLESPDSTITMSAWIYMYGWSKTGDPFNPVLMKSNSGGNAFQYRLSIGPGGIGVNFNNWNTGYVGSFGFDFFNWYMVAITYDADSLRYYVNGDLIAATAFNVKMIPDSQPLEIGRDVPGYTEHFNGRIDDVRIYNRALPEEEIALLYDSYHQSEHIFEPVNAFPDSGTTSDAYAVIWGDYNADTHPDIFMATSGDSNLFFTQTAEGAFQRENSSLIFPEGSNSRSAAWADFDNDGDLDLVVIRFNGKNKLYENNGDGTFSDQTASPVSELSRSSTDAAWGDYDGDSFLDLIVANRDEANELYHNHGDGTFARIDTGVIVIDNRSSITPTWIDIDEDGDLDLYITNTFAYNNFLYINHGSGFFTRSDTSIITLDGKHGSSPSWGDYDNDGDLDLFVSNTNNEPGENNSLYRNDGQGLFTRITTLPLANDKGVSAGSCWGDIDNDGDLDLVVANGEFIGARKNFIYLNKGMGEFERLVGEPAVEDLGQSDGISLVDWDGDGALEMLVANRDRNSMAYENLTTGNWLELNLVGTTSNWSAIGTIARARAVINGRATWQTRLVASNAGRRSGNGMVQHFGLGDAGVVDSLLLEWPSGLVEIYKDLDINRMLTLTEGAATTIDETTAAQSGPETYALFQNYPNPFNPVTFISWQLSVGGHLELKIYDALGRRVATPVTGFLKAGFHSFRFDASHLPSGIYFYRIQIGDTPGRMGEFSQVRKMVLIK